MATRIKIVLALALLATAHVSAATPETVAQTDQPQVVEEGYLGGIDKMLADRTIKQRQIGDAPALAQLLATERSLTNADHPGSSRYVTLTDVHTSVYADHDHDGYFTKFSLDFDVDSFYGYEYVYAKIYLRGPYSQYELFHVTDVFEIYSDLGSDTYHVDSRLVNDFSASHYDVKIEIFISGNPQVQDALDARTHRSLQALPLEAEDYDDDYSSTGNAVVHEYAGSVSLFSVLMLFGFAGCYIAVRRSTPII